MPVVVLPPVWREQANFLEMGFDSLDLAEFSMALQVRST